jgi:hypothetical protein
MLRESILVVHADKRWWRAVAVAGLCGMTLFGYPIGGGFIIAHLENTRKGYATPLPPLVDWSTRWLMGLFAVLIDFIFYALPAMVTTLLFFCGGLTLVMQRADESQVSVLWIFGIGLGIWWLVMFLSGVSAIGRLVYVDDSGAERCLSGYPLREAFRRHAWKYYATARVWSIPLYIIPLICIGSMPWILNLGGIGAWIGGSIVVWLFFCSLFYAHLVTMQIYHRVDLQLQSADLERSQFGMD